MPLDLPKKLNFANLFRKSGLLLAFFSFLALSFLSFSRPLLFYILVLPQLYSFSLKNKIFPTPQHLLLFTTWPISALLQNTPNLGKTILRE